MPAPRVFLVCALLFAAPHAADAQTSPTPGFPDPVFDNPIQPPPKPYEPPIQPAPFTPPPPAPMFQPTFPGPRVTPVPQGPARVVTGTVCAVPAKRPLPAARCAVERSPVGARCWCGEDTREQRAGRVRVR